MEKTRKNVVTIIGAVLAGFGASLCCIVPVAVAVLGVGSAAIGAQLEPLRPYLLVLTFGLLGIAFFREYRSEPCESGKECSVPGGRTHQRVILWIVAAITLAITTFPYYGGYLL